MFCALHALVSECSAVFYSYYVGDMIKFIRDENAPYTDGVKVIGIFFCAQFVAQTFRNRYILAGF